MSVLSTFSVCKNSECTATCLLFRGFFSLILFTPARSILSFPFLFASLFLFFLLLHHFLAFLALFSSSSFISFIFFFLPLFLFPIIIFDFALATFSPFFCFPPRIRAFACWSDNHWLTLQNSSQWPLIMASSLESSLLDTLLFFPIFYRRLFFFLVIFLRGRVFTLSVVPSSVFRLPSSVFHLPSSVRCPLSLPFVFCFLSPVFCLRSSVLYLLSSCW